MSTVVCHLFVVRVLERSAVCSQALCVVSGEALANFERPSRSHFSLDSRQQSHPRLANDKAFATVYLFFKIRHTLTSNEARKVGLVTVVSLGVVRGEVPSPSYFSLDSRQQAILV